MLEVMWACWATRSVEVALVTGLVQIVRAFTHMKLTLHLNARAHTGTQAHARTHTHAHTHAHTHTHTHTHHAHARMHTHRHTVQSTMYRMIYMAPYIVHSICQAINKHVNKDQEWYPVPTNRQASWPARTKMYQPLMDPPTLHKSAHSSVYTQPQEAHMSPQASSLGWCWGQPL